MSERKPKFLHEVFVSESDEYGDIELRVTKFDDKFRIEINRIDRGEDRPIGYSIEVDAAAFVDAVTKLLKL